ncbi:MAG: flagellar assembly protein A, partial [Sulfuricurvum sp.]
AQKYQQFQLFWRKLEILREEHREKQERFTHISEQYIVLQNEIFDARIINHGRWHNYNEIIFKLIEPPIDVTYFPMDGSDESVLGLHQDENGEFSIKVLSK